MLPIRSGAPPSSVLMWAVSAQTTAPQRGRSAWRATTLAPVPLKTGHVTAPAPTWPGDDVLQPRRVGVLAVGDLVAAVGLGERREHLGVQAGVVVGREAAALGVVQGAHGVLTGVSVRSTVRLGADGVGRCAGRAGRLTGRRARR